MVSVPGTIGSVSGTAHLMEASMLFRDSHLFWRVFAWRIILSLLILLSLLWIVFGKIPSPLF